ncbi:MAG: hypothetical protein JWP91_1713 [Fibrobacteres bacterium]|nr:hypothetical protein [Fibrobacterota bacterium]
MRHGIPNPKVGIAKMARHLGPSLAYALIFALALQAALPGFAEPTRSVTPPASSSSMLPSASLSSFHSPSSPPAALDLGGPTVTEFKAAFPGAAAKKVDPITFNRYVSLHSGQGRRLTGPALAAAIGGNDPARDRSVKPEPGAFCDSLLPKARKPCRDSLHRDSVMRYGSRRVQPQPARIHEEEEPAGRDTIVLGTDPGRGAEADHLDTEEGAVRTNWFLNLFVDLTDREDGHGHGGGGWSGDDWAAIIYVVIGVVVVGAFVIYGIQAIAELAINQEDAPLFFEAGLRLSYSGKAFEDPNGSGALYRDAYLGGLRFAMGFDRPGMDLGITVEGGYIDVFLRSLADPSTTFDFKGGYLLAGPMLRFGDNDPWSFSLEFLNGTSDHESIGWISHSRMTLQAKVAEHVLVGAHLGAVFYDLHFLDGLGVRKGNFNRDLSMIYGLDVGWAF